MAEAAPRLRALFNSIPDSGFPAYNELPYGAPVVRAPDPADLAWQRSHPEAYATLGRLNWKGQSNWTQVERDQYAIIMSSRGYHGPLLNLVQENIGNLIFASSGLVKGRASSN